MQNGAGGRNKVPKSWNHLEPIYRPSLERNPGLWEHSKAKTPAGGRGVLAREDAVRESQLLPTARGEDPPPETSPCSLRCPCFAEHTHTHIAQHSISIKKWFIWAAKPLQQGGRTFLSVSCEERVILG